MASNTYVHTSHASKGVNRSNNCRWDKNTNSATFEIAINYNPPANTAHILCVYFMLLYRRDLLVADEITRPVHLINICVGSSPSLAKTNSPHSTMARSCGKLYHDDFRGVYMPRYLAPANSPYPSLHLIHSGYENKIPLCIIREFIGIAQFQVQIANFDSYQVMQQLNRNRFFIQALFYRDGREVDPIAHGARIATFYSNRGMKRNRYSYWDDQHSTAKFSIQILSSTPRYEQPLNLNVVLQLMYNENLDRIIPITPPCHLLDLRVVKYAKVKSEYLIF